MAARRVGSRSQVLELVVLLTADDAGLGQSEQTGAPLLPFATFAAMKRSSTDDSKSGMRSWARAAATRPRSHLAQGELPQLPQLSQTDRLPGPAARARDLVVRAVRAAVGLPGELGLACGASRRGAAALPAAHRVTPAAGGRDSVKYGRRVEITSRQEGAQSGPWPLSSDANATAPPCG